MTRTNQLLFLVRYKREFVISEFVITKFDCILMVLFASKILLQVKSCSMRLASKILARRGSWQILATLNKTKQNEEEYWNVDFIGKADEVNDGLIVWYSQSGKHFLLLLSISIAWFNSSSPHFSNQDLEHDMFSPL
jgi:hypothetical protein